MILYILLILILLLLILYTTLHFKYLEEYSNLTLKLDYNKSILFIDNKCTFNIEKYTKKFNNIQIKSTQKNIEQSAVVPIYNMSLYKNSKVLTVLPEEYILVFITEKTVKIDYSTLYIPVDIKNIINIIVNLNKNFKNTKIVTYKTYNKILLKGNIVALCDTLENISHLLNKEVAIVYNVIDYDIDINLLKLYMPYSLYKNINMSIYLKKYNDQNPIKSLLVFNNFIILLSSYENFFDYELYELISNINDINILATNNYYTMYFDYSHITLKFLSKYNNYINTRSNTRSNTNNLQILESYKDDSIIDINENVKGFYDSNKGEFYPINDNLLDFKIVKLVNQHRPEENGVYKIQNNILIKRDNKKLIEDSQFDAGYVCYNEQNTIKGLCKEKWDRPCKTNLECPFYQANKTYPNYRGGCIDGHCEFPLGLERISYRKFDPKTKPTCHSCPVENRSCCDSLKVKDYVFASDDLRKIVL